MHSKEANSLYNLFRTGQITGQLQQTFRAMIREVWGPRQQLGEHLVGQGCLPKETIARLNLKQVLGKCFLQKCDGMCERMDIGKNMILQGISMKLVFLD